MKTVSEAIKTPRCTHTATEAEKGNNYAEMKAWQNERCSQLEPWLFRYFNIYKKNVPPTVVWAVQYGLLYMFAGGVCGSMGEREKQKKIDKRSESKGVAQSDKRNSNEPSNKKFMEMCHASECIHQSSSL